MGQLLATLCLTGLPLAAASPPVQEVPPNDGWVTDLAGVLSPEEEASLEALMESYRSGTTHEIALLTIPSLEGESLERLSLETARKWGLGGEGANNGALLLVSVGDRKLRIEVGRGLEGTLTDAISARIIRDVIAPEFQRGDYPSGVRKGIEAMHAAIGGDYGPIETSRGAQKRSVGGFAMGLFFVFVLLSVLGRGRGPGGRGRGSEGFWTYLMLSALASSGGGGRGGGWSSGGGGGGFGGFGGGGGFSGGGASGGW